MCELVWREANRGHVSLDQLKVMSAIERCRTAALGGHVARCENDACANTAIAYNSCRNLHCPKCQGAAARQWLAAREGALIKAPSLLRRARLRNRGGPRDPCGARRNAGVQGGTESSNLLCSSKESGENRRASLVRASRAAAGAGRRAAGPRLCRLTAGV
jgi:hypothetical protein